MDLNKAIQIWIEHINDTVKRKSNNNGYDGRSLKGFCSGIYTSDAYKEINKFFKDNESTEAKVDLTSETLTICLMKCLLNVKVDDMNMTTFNFIEKIIEDKKILNSSLNMAQIEALKNIKDSAANKFHPIIDDINEENSNNNSSSSTSAASTSSSSSSAGSTTSSSSTSSSSTSSTTSSSTSSSTDIHINEDGRPYIPETQANNTNSSIENLLNILVNRLDKIETKFLKDDKIKNDVFINEENSNFYDYATLSIPELRKICEYRMSKKLTYLNHIRILESHKDNHTTPKQLWPNQFPQPFLQDSENFLLKYDDLISSFQLQTILFIIDFIKTDILKPLDLEIEEIRKCITSINKNSKDTNNQLNLIYVQQEKKLQEKFDNSYFKSLRHIGIPYSQLIKEKKIRSKNKHMSANDDIKSSSESETTSFVFKPKFNSSILKNNNNIKLLNNEKNDYKNQRSRSKSKFNNSRNDSYNLDNKSDNKNTNYESRNRSRSRSKVRFRFNNNKNYKSPSKVQRSPFKYNHNRKTHNYQNSNHEIDNDNLYRLNNKNSFNSYGSNDSNNKNSYDSSNTSNEKINRNINFHQRASNKRKT